MNRDYLHTYKVFVKKIVYTLIFLMVSSIGVGCHNAGVNEVSATDNGDGTFTYELEICLGGGSGVVNAESFGFWVDWTGGGNLVGYTNSVTGPNTGNTKNATTNPPVSGDGSLEYGDWDDTSTDTLSPFYIDECLTISLTFDEPMESFSAGGMQPNYVSDGCEVGPIDASYICNSSATYTVTIETYDCIGSDVSWGVDGGTFGSVPQDGVSKTWNYCFSCGSTVDIDVPVDGKGNPADRCDGGVQSYEVLDANGNVTASGGGDDSTSYSVGVDCTLPVELTFFNGKNINKVNQITWITLSEINSDYFELKRKNNSDWKTISKQKAQGNSNQEAKYHYTDKSYKVGTNYYKLIQYDFNGRSEQFGPIAINNVQQDIAKPVEIINVFGQRVDRDYKGLKIIVYQNGKVKRLN